MHVLSIVLLVFFILTAVLLILLVLVQNEEGDSMGGIFAGGGGSAFGSRVGNVLTRTTTVLGTLFLVLSLALALLNRGPSTSGGVEAEGLRLNTEAAGSWLEDVLNPPGEPAGVEGPAGIGESAVEEETAETEVPGVLE
jgi:preprotein translocase subunit SecG